MKIDPYVIASDGIVANVLFNVYIAGVLPLWVSNKGGMGKTSYLRVKCVNVSKTVGDTSMSKFTIND